MKCVLCEDSGWVCEGHPERPWGGAHGCQCGGAGMPCPISLPDGRELVTLEDAGTYITELPRRFSYGGPLFGGPPVTNIRNTSSRPWDGGQSRRSTDAFSVG
jgi:hypothetical protein